jgi:hypothetical protein
VGLIGTTSPNRKNILMSNSTSLKQLDAAIKRAKLIDPVIKPVVINGKKYYRLSDLIKK